MSLQTHRNQSGWYGSQNETGSQNMAREEGFGRSQQPSIWRPGNPCSTADSFAQQVDGISGGPLVQDFHQSTECQSLTNLHTAVRAVQYRNSTLGGGIQQEAGYAEVAQRVSLVTAGEPLSLRDIRGSSPSVPQPQMTREQQWREGSWTSGRFQEASRESWQANSRRDVCHSQKPDAWLHEQQSPCTRRSISTHEQTLSPQEYHTPFERRLQSTCSVRKEVNPQLSTAGLGDHSWPRSDAEMTASWQKMHQRGSQNQQRPLTRQRSSSITAAVRTIADSEAPIVTPMSSSVHGGWADILRRPSDYGTRSIPYSGPQEVPRTTGMQFAEIGSSQRMSSSRMELDVTERSPSYLFQTPSRALSDGERLQERAAFETRKSMPDSHGKVKCLSCGRVLKAPSALERHILSKHDGYNSESRRLAEAKMQTQARLGTAERRHNVSLGDLMQFKVSKDGRHTVSSATVPSAIVAYYREQSGYGSAKVGKTPHSKPNLLNRNPATSAPVQCRGKERLVPKKKKLSALKKVILRERAARGSARPGFDGDCQSQAGNEDTCSFGTDAEGQDSDMESESEGGSGEGSESRSKLCRYDLTYGEEQAALVTQGAGSTDTAKDGMGQGHSRSPSKKGRLGVNSGGSGSGKNTNVRLKSNDWNGSADAGTAVSERQNATAGSEVHHLMSMCQQGPRMSSDEHEAEVREALERLVLAQQAFVAAVGGRERNSAVDQEHAKSPPGDMQPQISYPSSTESHEAGRGSECSTSDGNGGRQFMHLSEPQGSRFAGGLQPGKQSEMSRSGMASAEGVTTGHEVIPRSPGLRKDSPSFGASAPAPQVPKKPESSHSRSSSDAGKGSTEGDGAKDRKPNTYIGPDVEIRYCKQIITTELNRVTIDLLKELLRFQERAKARDPVKAKKKRRLVVGLREVARAIRTKRAKSIIVAPNIEEITSEGGLDCTLQSILEQAEANQMEVVFALTRSRIAQAFGRRVRMSTVAICDYDGANDLYKEMLRLATIGRAEWTQIREQRGRAGVAEGDKVNPAI